MKPNIDLPEDWAWVELGDVSKVILSNVDKKTSPDESPVHLCNYTYVYYNDYIDRQIDFMAASASEREIERFRLRKSDVLITKDSEVAEDIAVSAVVSEDLGLVLCGYHLAIIRPDSSAADGVYLSKLFGLHSIRHYFSRLANGVTRFGLTSDSIKMAKLPLPRIEEQRRIAAVLQAADSEIDALSRLTGQLQDQRRGLMQELLTGEKRLRG